MIYKYACFDRFEGCKKQRGELAGVLDTYPYDDRSFIVCKVEASVVIAEGTTLKLDALMKKHPNSTEQVLDEDGVSRTVDVFGYFDINGRSSEAKCPVISGGDYEL